MWAAPASFVGSADLLCLRPVASRALVKGLLSDLSDGGPACDLRAFGLPSLS